MNTSITPKHRAWCLREAQQCFLLAAAALSTPTSTNRMQALLLGAMGLTHLAASDPEEEVLVMSTHRSRVCCPKCKTSLGRQTNADGWSTPPTPGSVGVCAECHFVFEFDESLVARAIPQEKWDSYDDGMRRAIEKAIAMSRGFTKGLRPS
jgi:hypothetical protein